MKRRWKIILALIVALPLAVGIELLILHLGPENDLSAYKKLLIAKGEKLEIAEVLPPPIPPGQNGADLVTQAINMLGSGSDDGSNLPPVMRMVVPGKAMVCFAQPDVRYPSFTNSWANLAAVVAYDRPATELLKQAMNFPALDFQIAYSNYPSLQQDYLEPLRHCALRLSAEAICDLQLGDAPSATTNICAILALVNGEARQRTLIDQLVRIDIASLAVQDTWELLQSTQVNDADLARLQKNWEQPEYLQPMENAFLMERALEESAIRKYRASPGAFFGQANDDSGPGFSGNVRGDLDELSQRTKNYYADTMWRVAWTYADELQMLKDDQLVLETIRTIETNGASFNPAYTNMMNVLERIQTTNTLSDWFDLQWAFSQGSEGLGGSLEQTMAAGAAKNMVITAIALKRYQLQHGNYPPDLNSLLPEYLTTVPLDPVDGNPLRYRVNADGTFLLYSIGPNGRDDGGNPELEKGVRSFLLAWQQPHALDWVWPQPATPTEIQSFHDETPK